jgi:glycerol-3-phosphate dehydrogenase
MPSKIRKRTGRRGRLAFNPQQWLMHKASQCVEKIDFHKLAQRAANSSEGKPWLDMFRDLPPAWPNQDELAAKAVELTLEQLASQGDRVEAQEVASMIENIRCRYDLDIHKTGIAALTAVLGNTFTVPDKSKPFTSTDLREWKHLETLKKYRKNGLGVIYLINHSSHLDEFMVDLQLAYAGLGLPLYAAGANMMATPSVAKLLMIGSYVVQRRGASRVGLSALYNYCRAISVTGGEQGIFLEAWHGGARSRDGSLRYPRRLVTLRGALDVEGDVVIQPISVSYSVIPEDLSLCAKKGGKCWLNGVKPLSVLKNLTLHPKSALWHSIRDLYGRAYVDIAEPVLLSELKEKHQRKKIDLEFDEYVALTSIKKIARSKKVMASQLVARGLSRASRQNAVGLKQAVQLELDRLTEYHKATFGCEPDLEDFIREHSLEEVIQDGLGTLKKRKVVAGGSMDPSGLPQVESKPGANFYATHGDRRIYSPTADKNIVVVGSEGWGFSFTHLVGNRILEEKRYLNASLTLFEPNPVTASEMNINRGPVGRLEEYRLPKNAFVTSDLTSAFRTASEVILVPPRRRLADLVGQILDTSEQGLKLVVGTCGFEPDSHRLPCQLVYDQIAARGRTDVSVFALVGPVSEEAILEGKTVSGVLAGPQNELRKLSDLFKQPHVDLVMSNDPLGVQAASILARAYALWGHYLSRSAQLRGAAQVGAYMARAAREATELGMALGGQRESFSAGSPAWTAILVAEGLSGVCREFGLKLGGYARKKGSLPETAQKIYNQMEDMGKRLTGYEDIRSAFLASRKLELDLPILEEAYATIWGTELV